MEAEKSMKFPKFPSETHWIESLSDGDLLEFRQGEDPADGRIKLLCRYAWGRLDQLSPEEQEKVLKRGFRSSEEIGTAENKEVVILPW